MNRNDCLKLSCDFVGSIKQGPTCGKVGNKLYDAPKGLLSTIWPTSSNSRRIGQIFLFWFHQLYLQPPSIQVEFQYLIFNYKPPSNKVAK